MTRRSAIYNMAAALAAQCRADYDDYLLTHYEKAADACCDRLVNRRGMQRGVKADELFQGVGHVAKARAFASEELRDFWEREPLLSREAYERQWLQANYGGIIT